MRNRYAGTCYRCGQRVEPGQGHFERHKGGWRTQHDNCAIKHRNALQGFRERIASAVTVAVRTADKDGA